MKDPTETDRHGQYIQLSLFDESPNGVPTKGKDKTTDHKNETKTRTEAMKPAEKVNKPQAESPAYDLAPLFERLAHSPFRSRFCLSTRDRQYIRDKGLDTIRQHAADFVAKRLAPADIPNDGKQTPMRGHPVFLAQHATGCCCRGCFLKWHHIPPHRQLTDEEQQYAVAVLMEWIQRQLKQNK